jgi:hypothetical protein
MYREKLARVPKVLKNPVIGEDKPKRDREGEKPILNVDEIMKAYNGFGVSEGKQQLARRINEVKKEKDRSLQQSKIPTKIPKRRGGGRQLGMGSS